MSTSSDSNPRRFSAFWPLLIVVVTLTVLQVFGIMRISEQRKQLRDNVVKLEEMEKEGKKVDALLGAISQDLLNLAETNATARRVVTDFQIRKSEPAK